MPAANEDFVHVDFVEVDQREPFEGPFEGLEMCSSAVKKGACVLVCACCRVLVVVSRPVAIVAILGFVVCQWLDEIR